MTRITAVLSGFNPRRVLGTGTALDTARLRYLLGAYFHVDPRNMHAYVMGEHGDSEFVPWSQAMMATKPVLSICEESHGRYCCEEMEKITEEVRGAAQKIIEAKRATYYGIGMALVRITRAIFGNENSVLTVSSMMRGEYGETGVFVGAPCIVNRNGVQRILQLSLNDEEMAQFKASCETLRTHLMNWGCNNTKREQRGGAFSAPPLCLKIRKDVERCNTGKTRKVETGCLHSALDVCACRENTVQSIRKRARL